MKRPEYVAAAVSACRHAVDQGAIPAQLAQDLEAVFSRSGFTKGYLTGKRGAAMFGVRRKEDVTQATEKVFAQLRGLYRGERQRVAITLELGGEGDRAVLMARDREGREARASAPLEAAGRPPLPRARCLQQLHKTGGTPFLVEAAAAPAEGIRLAVSALNALRREALLALLAQRERREPVPFAAKAMDTAPHPRPGWERLPVRACFRSPDQMPPQARRCREIALPLTTPVKDLERLREEGWPPILLELPRAMFGAEERIRRLMEERMAGGFMDFTCGNLGAVALCRELGARAHGTFSLNIANTPALDFFQELGLQSAECSFELTGRELEALGGSLPRGTMVYGRQALMLTRNCPLANSPKGCLGCKSPGCLTDRKRKRFPVVCARLDGELLAAELLNSVPLWLGDREDRLGNMDFGVFRFTVENPVESGQVLEAFFRQEPLGCDYTRGLFQRGVE